MSENKRKMDTFFISSKMIDRKMLPIRLLQNARLLEASSIRRITTPIVPKIAIDKINGRNVFIAYSFFESAMYEDADSF